MKRTLLPLLVDPVHRGPLTLRVVSEAVGDVLDGELVSTDSRYEIRDAIPRFVGTRDAAQLQTSAAFGFKWRKRETYDSPQFKAWAAAWCVEKYGFETFERWCRFFDGRERILDVGCGSGFSSSLWLDSPYWTGRALWAGADISTAIDVARERLGDRPNTHFVQADALQLPFADGSFDTAFSEGVLHHTPSTRDALFSASRVVAAGGEVHFYVYRRKGPVREFTDDHIRAAIEGLSDEAAWDAMRSLTLLGRALHESGATIDVPMDVPLLGIGRGPVPVQRLVYWHFAKLYWNPSLSIEENVHVNFDWYRPRYAHRQTAAEVKRWCDEAGLDVRWFHEQESGYTVRATKR